MRHNARVPTEIDARPPLTQLSEDESAFRDAVRTFAQGEIAPRARAMEEAGRYDADLLPKLFEMGLMGVDVPEAYGGAGGTFFQSILAVEEVSRADAAVGVLVDVQNTLFNNALARWGTEAQKKAYLPRVASDTVAAYALSEASSGSDAFALKLRAKVADDAVVLDGHKLWITNAAEAGLFVVFANADPDKGYKGITAFLVEKEDPGFSVGKREHKLGIKASSTCELRFDGCRIPRHRVLGEVGRGYKYAIETLNEGRIGIGAQMLGVAEAALAAGTAYARERVQFGKPVAEFQAMQHLLADCDTRIEAARLLVWNAARRRDAGLSFVREAAMAKLVASDTAEFVTSSAVEIFGGNGYTTEFPVEKLYRDAKIGKIYEGTSFMQKATIAKALLAGD
ncbi:MAG TPA: acyl-CoA dehydrogenase family protein [Candidatus Polarisedimenticolaceae bacterium]|nr:acyl-CoA dehydrogenase family protein [Candidatus Polarisedimenticolaceae bacterium]